MLASPEIQRLEQLEDASNRQLPSCSYTNSVNLHVTDYYGQNKDQNQRQEAKTNCDIIILPLSLTSSLNGEARSELNDAMISQIVPINGQPLKISQSGSNSTIVSQKDQLLPKETMPTQCINQQISNETSQTETSQHYPPAYCTLPGIVPLHRGRNTGPPPTYADIINPDANPPTYQSLYDQVCERRKTSCTLWQLTMQLVVLVLGTIGCTFLFGLIAFAPLAMIAMGSFYIDDCRIEHLPAFLLMGGLLLLIKNILQCYSHCEPVPSPHTITISPRFIENHHGLISQHNDSRIPARPATFASVETQSNTTSGLTLTSMLTNEIQNDNFEPCPADGTYREPSNDNTSQDFNHNSPRNNRTSGNHHATRVGISSCKLLIDCIFIGWFFAGCLMIFRSYEPNYNDRASHRYCNQTLYLFTFYLIVSIGLICSTIIAIIIGLMIASALFSKRNLDDDANSSI